MLTHFFAFSRQCSVWSHPVEQIRFFSVANLIRKITLQKFWPNFLLLFAPPRLHPHRLLRRVHVYTRYCNDVEFLKPTCRKFKITQTIVNSSAERFAFLTRIPSLISAFCLRFNQSKSACPKSGNSLFLLKFPLSSQSLFNYLFFTL